jgi:hypothetical protein
MRMRIRLFTLMRIRIRTRGPDPSFQIKAQTLEKVLKYSHIPYIWASRLQIDADPVPDPAYHFNADQDLDFYLMRIRIHSTSLLGLLAAPLLS